MRNALILVAVAFATTAIGTEYEGAQEKQSGAAQEMQKDRDPPPGAENMSKRAERAQNAAPMKEGQGQNPDAGDWQKPK